MNPPNDPKLQVFAAARDQGVSSVHFRNAIRQKLGLNVTDSECLSYLAANGGTATPTELARYTSLTTGSTTAMLDRLENAGFITRMPNPSDRRGTLISLTKRYAHDTAPLVAGVQAAHQKLLAKYSPQELELIAGFLTKFTQNVQNATDEINAQR